MQYTTQEIVLSALFVLLIAGITAYYARTKGRNPVLWFFITIFLGILAPILIFFLSLVNNDKKEDYPTMTRSNPDPALEHLAIPPMPALEAKVEEDENKLWYYLDENHEQIGPVSVIALKELWNRGQLELRSYVWTTGMPKWERVDDMPDLKNLLR